MRIQNAIIFAAAGFILASCSGKEKTAESAKTRAPQPEMTAPPGELVTIGKLTGVLPPDWKSVPPASAMRKAQFRLPPVAGDSEPGEMSVFYLGPDAGGVESNLQRWYDQFEQPDGRPTADVATRFVFPGNGMNITMVQFTGTMKGSAMPGAPQTPRREHWMNLSAIVMTPDGPWFFKGTGPEATMTTQLPMFQQFLQSLKFHETT